MNENPEHMEEELYGDELPPALLARLQNFSQALSHKRKEAIDGRLQSGIETIWQEDEDAYEGVDDANRDEASDVYKPRTLAGAFEAKNKKRGTKSTVFLNVTRPYVDTASSRVGDMLLPTDDRAWSIQPSPIPDLPEIQRQRRISQKGELNEEDAQILEEELEKIKEEATAKAEKAQKRIEDWHIETQWHAEARQVIEDCSRIGTGVFKGPFPKLRKYTASIDDIIYPASKRVNPWNCYPDPACGQKIQNGGYFFEKDHITSKQVVAFLDDPTYIPQQVRAVLKEGPGKTNADGSESRTRYMTESELFEIWYCYIMATPEDLESSGTIDCEGMEGAVPVIATMINDHVVKMAMNPLESGEYPYDFITWQRRYELPWGIGVGRQIRTPQRMINAATRNMMDNSGLSSGPQLIYRKGQMRPADDVWEFTPRKLWVVNEDAEPGNLNEIFAQFQIESRQNELMEIINFALKMAEESTGLPMLMQGQMGKAPDTLGGMQMLYNSANTVMRRIAKLFDDNITEPHIRRYYEWIMVYGEDSEKGDFVIDARGSSALVERDIQNQALQQMGAMVKDPAFGVNPKKWFEEFTKSQHLDPARILYTDEEMEAIQQNMANQPQDPRIQAEQLRAQMKQEELKFQAQEAEKQRQHDKEIKSMEYQIRAMEFAEQKGMKLEELKAKLAQFMMGERNKRDLFTAERQLKLTEGSGI